MEVTVHYLFSRNKKIGSKIICWGTKHLEPEVADTPSHVAVLVNGKWVFESTLETGVRRISYEEWKKINHEIEKLPCKTTRTLEEVIGYYRKIHKKKYDYKGLTYFAHHVAMNKFFGIAIPDENHWEDRNMYFCSEVIGEMLQKDFSMTAPVQILVQAREILR